MRKEECASDASQHNDNGSFNPMNEPSLGIDSKFIEGST
jgi:hypothetical protein